MKKILLLSSSLTLSLYAQSDFFIGASGGAYHENFTKKLDAKMNSSVQTIKIGYGVQNTYNVEFLFDYIKNDSKIFSSSSSKDGNRYGLNIMLSKRFDIYRYFLPTLKAGFGTGSMKIDRTIQNSLYYGSYNLSAGFIIPINKTYEIECGYDYRYTSYQAIDTISQKIQYHSHISIVYAGFNIRF